MCGVVLIIVFVYVCDLIMFVLMFVCLSVCVWSSCVCYEFVCVCFDGVALDMFLCGIVLMIGVVHLCFWCVYVFDCACIDFCVAMSCVL